MIRWLMGFLADPRLLRLILCRVDNKPLPYTVEHAFNVRKPDGVLPTEGRELARAMLVEAEVFNAACPALAWARILAMLRMMAEADESAKDVKAVAGLNSLDIVLFKSDRKAPRRHDDDDPYYELHAHVRGAVPFEALWTGWVTDPRWRSELRTSALLRHTADEVGWNWAELVEKVAEARHGLLVTPPTPVSDLPGQIDQEVRLMRTLAHDVAAESTGSSLAPSGAGVIAYLAVAVGLAVALRVRRGQDKAGLVGFKHHYSRLLDAQKRGVLDEERTLVRVALDRFSDEGAAVVELRPLLGDRRDGTPRRLRALILGYLDHLHHAAQRGKPSRLVFGIVPSIFKQTLKAGAPREHAEAMARQVQTLLELLDQVPIFRAFVVGLDAAGQERGCPPGALVPAFEVLRSWHKNHGLPHARPGRTLDVDWILEALNGRSPDEAWGLLEEQARTTHPPRWGRLGRTVHAGEDFVDPITGLRQIDQTLRLLDLRAGDRLGHALAAGLNPDAVREMLKRRADTHDFVRNVAHEAWEIEKPRAEHLLDQAWLASRARGAEFAWPYAELAATASRIWAGAPALSELASSLLATPPGQATIPAVFHSGRVEPTDMERVRVGPLELQRFDRLRKELLAEIARRGVTIESCPTSNRVVANLEKAPAARLMGDGEDLGLQVAIATDDPGLLGAWPADELAALSPGQRKRALYAARQAAFIRPEPS